MGIQQGDYQFVVVDEAGHATEPACIAPACSALGKDGRLVLCGDPHQLAPLVLSKVCFSTHPHGYTFSVCIALFHGLVARVQGERLSEENSEF
jgi:superfamily I DNA and/or RNA helicase